MPDESSHERLLGGQLLASVSRSFYLTLKALPEQLREPISLAYLLARTADTIADTAQIPAAKRLDMLQQFAALVQQPQTDPTPLAEALKIDFLPHQTDAAEAALMEKLVPAVDWLRQSKGSALIAIQSVLDHIIRGQMLDIQRFPEPTPLRSLQTAPELEEYTWLVAGCVGEFWTQLCADDLPGAFRPGVQSEQMIKLGADYGKALQLINILRDLGKDARLGRCYFPAEQWRVLGLSEASIQSDPACLLPIWQNWYARCRELLPSAISYVANLQNSTLRYATALPVLLGIRTLGRLREASPAELVAGVKISRMDVTRVLAQTALNNHPEKLTRLAQRWLDEAS